MVRGGKREGAGRPTKANIKYQKWVTTEEKSMMDNLLGKIRNGENKMIKVVNKTQGTETEIKKSEVEAMFGANVAEYAEQIVEIDTTKEKLCVTIKTREEDGDIDFVYFTNIHGTWGFATAKK